MLVKSLKAEDYINHLKEVFDILRRYVMKPNPEKYAFGVASRKFLGFLVSQRGIEVNPDQVDWVNHRLIEIQLTAYLSSPPLLSQPEPEEHLLVYLAISEVAVSAVLIRETKGKQSHIYYISKTLVDTETRYPHLEKLALALIVASRKLRPYFQCHPISVVTIFTLREILHKPELSGSLAKWANELSEHGIMYQPRTTIKSQVLADFVTKCSAKIIPEVEKEVFQASLQTQEPWVLYTHGVSNASRSRLGLVLEISTGKNAEADDLTKLVAATKSITTGDKSVVHLLYSSLDQVEVRSVSLTWDWHNRIIAYFHHGALLNDKKEAKKLRMQAARYNLLHSDLYRRTYGSPLVKCLGPNQTQRVLEKVYEGHCGAHSGNRALVRCLIRAGYYWPTMKKKCEQCQKYAPVIHQLGEHLQSVTSPWPFIK
uniref:Reverse transcriptase/retrotransposon-derived protein RNase H-like domain-containing protein n=1 Tax=Nicotiana tabacum TaxID=4097 RepID=A0A1S4DBC8_TOBAC|nr:PREDICTED: uncharacterized protein LOC107827932 [Nicotiana tabacum]